LGSNQALLQIWIASLKELAFEAGSMDEIWYEHGILAWCNGKEM
jgi:hypothetical protein